MKTDEQYIYFTAADDTTEVWQNGDEWRAAPEYPQWTAIADANASNRAWSGIHNYLRGVSFTQMREVRRPRPKSEDARYYMLTKWDGDWKAGDEITTQADGLIGWVGKDMSVVNEKNAWTVESWLAAGFHARRPKAVSIGHGFDMYDAEWRWLNAGERTQEGDKYVWNSVTNEIHLFPSSDVGKNAAGKNLYRAGGTPHYAGFIRHVFLAPAQLPTCEQKLADALKLSEDLIVKGINSDVGYEFEIATLKVKTKELQDKLYVALVEADMRKDSAKSLRTQYDIYVKEAVAREEKLTNLLEETRHDVGYWKILATERKTIIDKLAKAQQEPQWRELVPGKDDGFRITSNDEYRLRRPVYGLDTDTWRSPSGEGYFNLPGHYWQSSDYVIRTRVPAKRRVSVPDSFKLSEKVVSPRSLWTGGEVALSVNEVGTYVSGTLFKDVFKQGVAAAGGEIAP